MSDKLTKAQAKLLMSWLNATLPDVAVPPRPRRICSPGLTRVVRVRSDN